MIKIFTTVIILCFCINFGYSQISGPTSVAAGSTHTYTYNSSYVVSPMWQVSGGTRLSQTTGSMNYTVTIQWGTGTSGGMALLDGGSHVASLSVTITPLPPAPVAIAPNNMTTTSFTARWNAVGGANGYYVDVSQYSNFSSMLTSYNNRYVNSGSSLSVTGLTAGTTYYYRVRAVVGPATSGNSNTITTVTLPAAPAISAATNMAATSFTANWGAVTSATGYRLDVSTSSTFSSFVSGYNNLSVSTTNRSVTGLAANTTYFYRVRAENSSGASANSNVATVPGIPVSTAPTSIASTSFAANWNSIPNATYRLDVSTSSSFSSFVSGYNNLSVSGTSHSVTGLNPGTTYYFRVRSVISSFTSGNSNSQSALTAPAAPTANVASGVTNVSFVANWTSVTSATQYLLDVSTSSTFSSFWPGYNALPISGTTATVANLSPYTQYYYRVRAVNASGASGNSNTRGVITLINAPTPSGVTNATGTSFNANWQPVSGAGYYMIDVSEFSNFSSLLPGFTSPIYATTQFVGGLDPTKTYYYRVRAFDGDARPSAYSHTVTVHPIPTAPSAQPASNITASSFTANWTAVATAANYQVEVSDNLNFSGNVVVLPSSGTSREFTGLDPNKTYHYRVMAINGTGSSPYSNTQSTITVPGPPTALEASDKGSTSFTANWSSGFMQYQLDVARDINFTDILPHANNILLINVTSHTIGNLESGRNYYYRVRSRNASGSSVNSNVVSALTRPAAPVANLANSGTNTSFVANWNSVQGAASYRLDVSTSSTFQGFLSGFNNRTVNALNETVANLTPGTTYYYRVRAYNASGSSSNSEIITVLPLPAIPNVLPPSSITAFSFTANWSNVQHATSYRLDVATSNNFSSGNMLPEYNNITVTGNNYHISGLTPGGTYFYRVRSGNTSGISGNSNIVMAMTKLEICEDNQTNAVYTNFIKSVNVLEHGLQTTSEVDNASLPQISVSYSFFDGLGRPSQNVLKQASPNEKDIVIPHEYDQYGREIKKYLPYVTADEDGCYKDNPIKNNNSYSGSPHYLFYTNGASDKVVDDLRPFGETIFESSPLNRPDKEYGPGADWGPNANNKFVKHSYLVNVFNSASAQHEKIISWKIDPVLGRPVRATPVNGFVEIGGYYSTSQLSIKSTLDEHGNEVREFTDKNGHMVLKKVFAKGSRSALNNFENWALTYYVYDDLGNLRFVLPPELSKTLHTNDSNNLAVDGLNAWAFQYKYDGKRRMSEKKLPGADWVYMVYDGRDRLVLTQDGEQRKFGRKKWHFIKYDQFNRPVLTGIYTHPSELTQSNMQDYVNTHVGSQNIAWFETYTNGAGNVHGYNNASFPQAVGVNDYLTVTYYDNYDFRTPQFGTDYGYVNTELAGLPSSPEQNIKGHVAGSKIKILGENSWIKTINYYDKRYRLIQVVSSNTLEGMERQSFKYNFPGWVMENMHTHTLQSVETKIKKEYTYDHAGRLENTYHTINNGPRILLSSNEYNELGELVDKSLHQEGSNNALQSIDYRYNIRGWLTHINNSKLEVSSSNNDDENDYFGMELLYNGAMGGFPALPNVQHAPQFNGNISAAKWSTRGGSLPQDEQAYVYNYDSLNRLTKANYAVNKLGAIAHLGGYNEVLSYDLNGNIKELKRYKYATVATLIDDLAYTYNHATGNQLLKIDDLSENAAGFKDGANSGNDYNYDANGNMYVDKNKGIDTIAYNHLNLPRELFMDGGKKVEYIYDAAGRKLAQRVIQNGTEVKRIDYVGEFLYETDSTGRKLQLIHHEEGRVVPDPITTGSYEYQYHIKDHLGNVRVTFTSKPKTHEYTVNYEKSLSLPDDIDLFEETGNIVDLDLFDHTDANGAIYTKSQRLTGDSSSQIGSVIAILVEAGDIVSAEVFAKYVAPTNEDNVGDAIASLLITALTNGEAPVNEAMQNKVTQNYGHNLRTAQYGNYQSNYPHAYLNIMFLPHDVSDITPRYAFSQIHGGEQELNTVIKASHYKMEINNFEVKEKGVIIVYLSNESSKLAEVYFDDLKITVNEHPVIQADDYYAFGMAFNSFRRETYTTNKFLYNAKELQEETNWYDYGARMYDTEIGRWHVVDPMAEAARRWTPYRYAFNNPLRFIDPDGMYEYSNGYTYIDSNDETASVKNTGNFNGTAKDVSRGSGPGRTVYASSNNGSSANIDGKGSGNNRMSYIFEDQNEESNGVVQNGGCCEGFVEKNGYYYFEGVRVLPRSYMANNTAMGVPEEIYIHPNALFLRDEIPNINLLRHEFGHILQYRRYGWGYFLVVGPVSAYSLSSDPSNHNNTWTELEANTLSYLYFGQPTDWDHNNYPIDLVYMNAVIKSNMKREEN